MVSRRFFLEKLGAIALTAYLPGCAHPIHTNICSPDIRRADPNKKPLTIDVHAHFFNASDVHVDRLLRDVIAKDNEKYAKIIEALSGILEKLFWTLAPNFRREAAALKKIRKALGNCPSEGMKSLEQDDEVANVVRGLRQEAYQDFLEDIRQAIAAQESQGAATLQAQRHLIEFPERAEDFFFEKSEFQSVYAKGDDLGNPKGVYNFVARQAQYRCVNFIDYLHTIGVSKRREVDLAVAHILDFDWPLGDGCPTATSLPDQIKLMSELSIISGGRVHCFVPFDPMKAVANLSHKTPLDIVEKAINEEGFIGVKIYPPMGFAPYCNEAIQARRPDFWQRDWLPDRLKSIPNLGRRLDDELLALYRWCRKNEVPIMSHTNMTMGPHEDFEELVDAKYWKVAIDNDKVRGLRVNFAHFGNTKPGAGTEKNRKLMKLMSTLPGSAGENLYVDSAFFSEILSDKAKLRSALLDLMEIFRSNSPPLFRRFMFGTDWEMNALWGDQVVSYLPSFEDILDAIEVSFLEAGDSDRFFGWNAAEFLGLKKGQSNRDRLERFYSRNSVPQPLWMKKVDGPSGLA